MVEFSIIIPLEFHRGLAERCIKAWVKDQSYPRERFEILLAVPETHDSTELRVLEGLLAAHDSIIRLPWHHDMPLMAQAARQAAGEVLVFTESHCLPEPDFLEQSAAVLAEHADWAGFSGRSIPLTHNLLSEIEAEMYDEHISRNMQHHPWLKVLDQCFIIRREAYMASGGFEPEYGHFAEWVLAARLHRQCLKIGFDSRAAIHHYYSGDLDELKTFTADFAAGQMRFERSAGTDPCGDLFEEVPEWTNRHIGNPKVAARFTRLFASDLLQFIGVGERHHRLLLRIAHWPWQLAWTWLGRQCISRTAKQVLLRLNVQRLSMCVSWHLSRGDKVHARTAFLRLISACGRLGWWQFLASEYREHDVRAAEQLSPQVHCSELLPGRFETLPSCGLHDVEQWNGIRFRWSEPAAMIWLPSLAGNWKMTIEWAGVQSVAQQHAARFYVNERAIPSKSIVHCENHTDIEYSCSGRENVRLAWICERVAANNDDRRLGLPVSRVSWTKTV